METQPSHDGSDVEFVFNLVQHDINSDDNDPEQSDYDFKPSFGSLANSIRKASRSLRNRLCSIKIDSEFVEKVVEAYQLPVVTNARAGDWYVNPEKRSGSVYFKSTDGHTGQWKFSLRRLNLGLLEVVEKGHGAIIVDSTRRGKRFPDSLAKTVPIWVAVLNKVCFPREGLAFYANTLAVSPSEASQIEERLGGFVEQFLSLGLDINPIKRLLRRPLRPIWVTPDSPLPMSPPEFADFVPLILVTASRMVRGEGVEGEYIQGAGDDHEGWAAESGLTPAIFWKNNQTLLEADEDELSDIVKTLAQDARADDGLIDITLVKPTATIYIGSLASVRSHWNNYEVIVNCFTEPLETKDKSCQIIDFPISEGKKGAKTLRAELGRIIGLLDGQVGKSMLFVCLSGNEIAPAVALTVLCLYYDDAGRFRKLEDRAGIDKLYIKRRLAWISSSRPEANPSRTSLNANLLANHKLIADDKTGSWLGTHPSQSTFRWASL